MELTTGRVGMGKKRLEKEKRPKKKETVLTSLVGNWSTPKGK